MHRPPTTPSRAASTLGPWPSGVFYLLFVCVQRWREQLDRKAAAALPVKGRGREGRGGRQIQALVSAAERSNCTDYGCTKYFMSWHRIYSAREVLCGAPRSLETNDEIGILHCIWPSGTRIRQILPGCRDPCTATALTTALSNCADTVRVDVLAYVAARFEIRCVGTPRRPP